MQHSTFGLRKKTRKFILFALPTYTHDELYSLSQLTQTRLTIVRDVKAIFNPLTQSMLHNHTSVLWRTNR